MINALDNEEARKHVNNMCFNLNIPLVDSGTNGYAAQVSFIHILILIVHSHSQGVDSVLSMRGEAKRIEFPCVHHQIEAGKAHSLYRVG